MLPFSKGARSGPRPGPDLERPRRPGHRADRRRGLQDEIEHEGLRAAPPRAPFWARPPPLYKLINQTNLI